MLFVDCRRCVLMVGVYLLLWLFLVVCGWLACISRCRVLLSVVWRAQFVVYVIVVAWCCMLRGVVCCWLVVGGVCRIIFLVVDADCC